LDFGTHRLQFNWENMLIMAADKEAKYDRYWPIATFPCAAKFGRYQGNSGHGRACCWLGRE
jgi:hypothetical protein